LSIILTSSVVFTWLMLAAAFAALGGLFLDRIGRADASLEHLFDSIWVGLALTMLGLMLWHFVFPLSTAFGAFSALSIAAVVAERRWFRPLLLVRSHLPAALGAVVLVAWTANHSLAAGGMDDYNYEFQAVRWFFEHPLVPGLANVHGRLGFNNSHHLLAALLSTGPWSGRVNNIVNGFVVSLALVYVFVALIRVQDASRTSAVRIFAAVLFAPTVGLVLFGIFGPAISTLKADVFVTAGIVILSCILVRFAESDPGTPEYRVTAATAILVACLLTTVKLSAATFCAVVLLAVMIHLVRAARNSRTGHNFPRVIVGAGVAGSLLLACFVARGYVLSGYPLYPSSAFALDVDWRVPAAQAEADRVFIKTWSQLRPTYDLASVAGREWVRGWLNSLVLTQKLSIVLPVVVLLTLAGQRVRPGKGSDILLGVGARPVNWALAVLGAASICALAVWFTQAPAARFASVYFWILLAAVITSGVRPGKEIARNPSRIPMAVGSAVLVTFGVAMLLRYARIEDAYQPGVFAVAAFGTLWAIPFHTAGHRTSVLFALIVLLGISQIGERAAAHAVRGRLDEIGSMLWHNVMALPAEPRFEHSARQTKTGLTIYVGNSSSFSSPIPNTRYFNPYLELRTPNGVRGGFRNPAKSAVGYGYAVDYVIQPNAGAEIVVPAGEK
jgi:hypothetical protein